MRTLKRLLGILPMLVVCLMTAAPLLGVTITLGRAAFGPPNDHVKLGPGLIEITRGSGFFVGRDLVLTAAHVVTNCREIDVQAQDLADRQASVMKAAPRSDLALLSVPDANELHVLGVTSPSDEADSVVAIGFKGVRRFRPPQESSGAKVQDEIRLHGRLVSPDLIIWSRQRDLRGGFSGSPILERRTGHVIGVLEQGAPDRASRGNWFAMSAGVDLVNSLLRHVPTVAAPGVYNDIDVRDAVVRIVCRERQPKTDVAGKTGPVAGTAF